MNTTEYEYFKPSVKIPIEMGKKISKLIKEIKDKSKITVLAYEIYKSIITHGLDNPDKIKSDFGVR